MNRKTEKRFLIAAAIWNILTSLLTILGYSNWLEEKGSNLFNQNQQTSYFSSSFLDNVIHVVMIYGLFIFCIGLISLVMAHTINRSPIDKKMICWLSFCLVLSFISVDIIGILLYLITLTLYMARNKAMRRKQFTINKIFTDKEK
ncbi:hypothetical protein MEPL4_2c00400 [Melissococcus plutonius]|uniref:DUF4064 domain-containing protein n=1 Tax=Melissococcus plutonius TaxID=33970 RepID=UPI00065DD986|nr:DUF4064 domain-containing protein [Melissococcus plutonius]AIM25478.1 hypothetical protein MEPL_c000930 [Melissococcus plutonius S1]KMT25748.1 hypothetical protein MEPL2_1c00940 [Melissococcus plutonius]KMT27093.1 hypothetical protein MEPL3_1c01210 [Melissococcus plutonius]KMT28194.1 hypothetical protein MEPL1_2c00240 [Melissococcus plutonius]KMT29931.1 hypothetical protein MEPL4_2c00400 [Melissococcus plutonius]